MCYHKHPFKAGYQHTLSKKKGILSPKAVSRESSSTQVRLMGKRRLTN